MKQALAKLFILISLNSFYAQNTIQGNLNDKDGNPILGATITLTKVGSDAIVTYGISKLDGTFSITINNKVEKLQINIRSISYKNVTQIIDNKTQTLNFVLEEEITNLKEVLVKSTPITKKGDTINYNVKAFAKQEDRTIADVIANLPGIEVQEDGRILYQGKSINKYYIEGLDLLEGKYNLANKNLPHREVVKVQILENHQPIRILDSLVFSDRAAINIKLKNSYTFTGQAQLGAGASPLIWDANITPILISNSKQLLNSYQSNNTGNDVALQLKSLTIEDVVDQFEQNQDKQDWLGIQTLRTPNFSTKRWLDNNIHLGTANYLQKLKNDYELRINVSYLNDSQERNGFTNTQFFTANDTIALFENNNNNLFINTLETNLTLQKNSNKIFLKNSLQFQGFWDSQSGTIITNDENIIQNLSNRYFKLSNNFKTLFPLGKQIATLKSYIGYSKTPQLLRVNPGQFELLLNNGNSFDEITQNLELNTWYTNNFVSFTKGFNAFSITPRAGFIFEIQDLETSILTSETSQNTGFENNLDWKRLKFYSDLQTQYIKNNWGISLSMPVNYYSYQLEDIPLKRSQNLNRLTFEPRVSIGYNLSSFWKLNTSANLSNQFGTINQVYFNYILQNYRNIQQIDNPLPENQSISFTTSVNYRNPIQALFFNFSYSNSTTTNNLLYNTQILENGTTQLLAIEQDNRRLSNNFTARLNKYFSAINTNITLSTNYSLQDSEQIINNELTAIAIQNWRLNGKVDVDIASWLNTTTESIFQFSNNEIQGQDNQTITQQFHKFNVNVYPKENQYLGLKTEYVATNLFSENTENLFADLIYRYTWKKKKIDFEIQLNNVFNTKSFRTIGIDEFTYVETNFNLRPRQILFKVNFSLK